MVPHIVLHLCFFLLLKALCVCWMSYCPSNRQITFANDLGTHQLCWAAAAFGQGTWSLFQEGSKGKQESWSFHFSSSFPLLLFPSFLFFHIKIWGVWSEETARDVPQWLLFSHVEKPALVLPLIINLHISQQRWNILKAIFCLCHSTFLFLSWFLVLFFFFFNDYFGS